MEHDIIITDIYWENIYLHLKLAGDGNERYQYYISDLRENIFPVDLIGNELLINIVNIEGTKLLKNGKWYLLAKMESEYQLIGISAECGYKLEDLDKVYRYGREMYAYVVTFSVKDSMEVLQGLKDRGKNRLMLNLHEPSMREMICMMHVSYMIKNKKNARRNIIVEASGVKEVIKKAMFIVLKTCIDTAYHVLAKLRKRDGHHVLLLSETRVPMGGNLKALDDRIKEREIDKTFKISYSFSKTLQQSKWKTLSAWTRLLWILPKQDVVFVDDYVPIFKTIHLVKDTKLIQLWHAGVGFKSVGYSRFGRTGSPLPLDSCHRQYDYAVVGGEGLRRVYEEVFGISLDRILPYGLPRLDGYMDIQKVEAYKEDFYSRYPELKERKIILFAPTYRGKTQSEAYYPYEWIDQKKICDLCGEKYIFAYKMHPFITEKVVIEPEYQSCIYDFTGEKDINELFYVTDILITDFSSNIYEFSLQRKPIIFFAPDKDYYQLTRGVHRKLDEAPGIVCESFDEVAEAIENERFDIQKIEKFVAESFDNREKYSSDYLIDNFIIGEGSMYKSE